MLTARPSPLVRFGVYEFDAETGDLWNEGHLIRLQEQPRQVLQLLLSHAGELVSREALRDELWPGETFVDFDAGLNVAVNKIRHALRDSASSPRFIETLPRRGYRFIAPVASLPAHDDVPGGVPDEGGAAVVSSEDQNSWFRTAIGRRKPRWFGLMLGSVAVVVAGIAVAVFLSRADRSQRLLRPAEFTSLPGVNPALAPSGDRSFNGVAVALFDNQTGDVALDPVGRLASERIIGMVAEVSGARVVARPVRIGAARPGESSVLAPNLDASVLVTGTFYVHQDGLEFQARILDASTGRLLHATAPVTGWPSQPGEALERLAQKVAGAIAIHFDDFFGGLEVVSHPPTLDAHREYRAGLETFASDYPRALTYLGRALEKDPGFLLPLVIMHFAHLNLGDWEEVETLLVRMEGQWDRLTAAERLLVEFLRASWEGRQAQALKVLEDLERLVPTSLVVNYNLVLKSVSANRPRAALDAYGRSRFSERTLRHSIGTFRHHLAQDALHLLGEYEGELRQTELAQRYAPGVLRFLQTEARALVALGRVADVPRPIDRSLSLAATAGPPQTPGTVMENTVRELSVHGYRDESLTLAARAVEWYRSRPADAATGRAHRAGFARALYLAERWEEAGALFSALAADDPGNVEYLGYLGCIAARTNDARRTHGISAELERVRGRTASLLATHARARIAALLGQRQRAVDLLRDALTQGMPYGVALHNDPDFEPLRDYEPFVALIRPSDLNDRHSSGR